MSDARYKALTRSISAAGIILESREYEHLRRLHNAKFDIVGSGAPTFIRDSTPEISMRLLRMFMKVISDELQPKLVAYAMAGLWGGSRRHLVKVAFLGFQCELVGPEVADAALEYLPPSLKHEDDMDMLAQIQALQRQYAQQVIWLKDRRRYQAEKPAPAPLRTSPSIRSHDLFIQAA